MGYYMENPGGILRERSGMVIELKYPLYYKEEEVTAERWVWHIQCSYI